MNTQTTKATERKQSRQQRGYSKTREKLMTAARSVFTEKGLGASVDEISQRADVARGSFYYHFKSKERLIRLLLSEILSKLTDRMNEECTGKQGLESVLDGIIQAHIGFFSARWEDFVLYYQGRADLTLNESYDGLEKSFLDYSKRIEQLIDGSIPEPISDERLRRIANAIAGFVAGYYSFASVAPTDEAIDIDNEFMSLRKAFVTSLARFSREAMPESQVKW
jgi:AcrR family transcriptional regulator